MSMWFEHNQEHLLERDPHLAERIRIHGQDGHSRVPPQDVSVPLCADQEREWLKQAAGSLVPNQLNLVLGLTESAFALKEHAQGPLWIVDPDLETLAEMMSRRSILPLLLNGRLFVGADPLDVVRALSHHPRASIIAHPGRLQAWESYFLELSRAIQARTDAIKALDRLNRAGRLREKSADMPELAALFAPYPAEATIDLEMLRSSITPPWSRRDRLIVTLDTLIH